MFAAALALTLVGFVLLAVTVVTGAMGWAWACIGICALGVLLLIVDFYRGRT
jgi:hypothetical protein